MPESKETCKFELMRHLSQCATPMAFEPDTVIATYGDERLLVSLEVQGEIEVRYQGTTYRHPKLMPTRLLRALEDERQDPEIDIASNDWFCYVIARDGIVDGDDIICDDDLAHMTDDQLRRRLADIRDEADRQTANAEGGTRRDDWLCQLTTFVEDDTRTFSKPHECQTFPTYGQAVAWADELAGERWRSVLATIVRLANADGVSVEVRRAMPEDKNQRYQNVVRAVEIVPGRPNVCWNGDECRTHAVESR